MTQATVYEKYQVYDRMVTERSIGQVWVLIISILGKRDP